MMKDVMKRQNVTSLPELLEQARQLGVRFVACEMAMNVMGITREELVEVDEVAGVASFVGWRRRATTRCLSEAAERRCGHVGNGTAADEFLNAMAEVIKLIGHR